VALGHWVRVSRDELGLSQRDLQRLAGVHQSVISRFERGQRPKLSATAVARILVALGLCRVEHPPGTGKWVRTLPRRLDLIARAEYQQEMRDYVEAAEDEWEAFVEVWNIQVELGERVIGRPWS
jgi:predicted transcriptional regulator